MAKTAEHPLAVREIVDNRTLTAHAVTVWYLLDPVRWSFRATEDRTSIITASAGRLAQLTGHRLHWRVTSRPYPVRRWAEEYHRRAPAPLPGWADFLVGEQEHLGRQDLSEKQVFLGVEVAARNSAYQALGRWWQQAVDRELAALEARIAEIDAIVAGPGFNARPASPAQMAWLVHRSVCLGMPAPLTLGASTHPVWEHSDLVEVTDRVHWTCQPYGASVRLVGHPDSAAAPITRHVVVLTVGRMVEMHVPERDLPWMQRSDRLPFPIEWSVRAEVLPAERVSGAMRQTIQRIRSQKIHFEDEHHEPAPPALERQAFAALAVEDELETGLEGLSTRIRAWCRLAVSAPTEAEALERARQVINAYGPQITIVRPADQYRLAREFIPGEPLANGGYVRRMPVTTLAGAVPAATDQIGDRVGMYLGSTSGTSRRAVLWDPWICTEVREQSGLVPLLGGLGGGKSTLGGVFAYKAARAGIPCHVLDPAGRLGKLCELPELAGHARNVDLLTSPPGVLNPYAVVPEPRLEHFGEEADPEAAWRDACTRAAAQRRALCTQILRALLPPSMRGDKATDIALLRALKVVGATPANSPVEVIEVLATLQIESDIARHARYMAEALEEAASTPHGRLILSPTDPATVGVDEAVLTIYSLKGLTVPSATTPREDWTVEQHLAVPVLHLAACLTQRAVYFGDQHARKLVVVDEAWSIAAVSTGRDFLNTSARDSRKHNAIVLLASHNAADLLQAGVGNLRAAALVGRTVDAEAQAQALHLLGLPTEMGYEQVLGELSQPDTRAEALNEHHPREFLFADGSGRIERIAIDIEGLPATVRAALNSTADPRKARYTLTPAHPGVLGSSA